MVAWIANTDAVVSMDNDANSLIDQSDYITTVTQDITISNGEFFVFGLSGSQRSEGNRSTNGTIGVRPSTDVAGLHYQLLQIVHPGSGNKIGLKTLTIDYPDSTAGSFRLSGEAIINDYNKIAQDASGDGSPASHSLSYGIDGDPTLTVLS